MLLGFQGEHCSPHSQALGSALVGCLVTTGQLKRLRHRKLLVGFAFGLIPNSRIVSLGKQRLDFFKGCWAWV